MTRWQVLALVGWVGTATAAPEVPEDVPLPLLEPAVASSLTLPALPSFELPPAEPGFETPKRLRVQGTKLLDTKVQVKGYITWIYRCIDAVRLPKESAAKAQKRIDADPTLCERAKFYLGDTRTTPLEKGLWVVDVPRPPNKLEKERLPKDELKNWPKVPKLKVGDYVVVTGELKLRSPHNEANSDGLLVFESIAPAKPSKAAASPAPAVEPATASRPRPALRAAPLAKIEPRQRGISVVASKNGTIALSKGNVADASKHFRDAVKAWPQNHFAWYGLGGSLGQQGDWNGARDAFARAVAVHPENPMYQLWHGVTAYEALVTAARLDQARKQGRDPRDVTLDYSVISFDTARASLETAVALEPTLWRAHYYLGRIHRAGGLARRAATELAEALRLRPDQQGPWIALGELLRKWDYTTEAIALMKVAVTQVPTVSDAWFVLGMAHDDNRDDAAAIEAFTKALDVHADNHKARFQRGQAYYRLKKYREARVDLEAYQQSGAPPAFAQQQANKMLIELAAKTK